MSLRVGIDIGETFIDFVVMLPDGRFRSHKAISKPDDFSRGVAEGLSAILLGEPVDEIVLSLALGAEAMLESDGRTAFVATAGFRDILETGGSRRPHPHREKPPPLVPRNLRFEVEEKIRPDGAVSRALDAGSMARAAAAIRAAGVEAVAVCFLHGYANPIHERLAADALREVSPGVAITASHEILPEIREFQRASTTAINARLQPAARRHFSTLSTRLKDADITAPLRLMQSNGGLASLEDGAAFPARLVRGAAASGVAAAAAIAARLGASRIIAFEMGGAGATAALVEDGFAIRTRAIDLAGHPLTLPRVDFADIGAGGGTTCRIDPTGAPKLGPARRGGGEPTLDDCNLALGRVDPAGGAVRIDREAAIRAIAEKLAAPMGVPMENAADGMLRIASAVMASGIRALCAESGRGARDFTLLAYGGAGPLFAAALARELGIRSVIIPPMPGVFGALGLLLADVEHHRAVSLRMRLDDPDIAAFKRLRDSLLTWGSDRLARDGFSPDRRWAGLTAFVRYAGQPNDAPMPLPPGDAAASLAALAEAFPRAHPRPESLRAPVELTGLSIVARGLPGRRRLPDRIAPSSIASSASRRVWFGDAGWSETSVVDRAALGDGPRDGPALIEEYGSTTLVPPGARASLDEFGAIRLDLGGA